MEKTRVPKGEKFWYIQINGYEVAIHWLPECQANKWFADRCFDCGNYFHTKEEAEAMTQKLRAALNGVEVIEMSDENEDKYYETQNYTNSFRESACVNCEYCKDTVCVLKGFSQFYSGQYRRPGLCFAYKSKTVK